MIVNYIIKKINNVAKLPYIEQLKRLKKALW